MKLKILTINKLVFCQLLFVLLQVSPAFGMSWVSAIKNWWNDSPRAQATAQLATDVIVSPDKVVMGALPYVKAAWQKIPAINIYSRPIHAPQGVGNPVVQPQPDAQQIPQGDQASPPIQGSNPPEPSFISRLYAATPSGQDVKQTIYAVPGAVKEGLASVGHGGGYVFGATLRGVAAGLVPSSIQQNFITAGTTLVNVVASPQVQQAIQRVGSELVTVANQPDNKGGATGMARHFAGAAAGEIAGKIVEEGVRPAVAVVGERIERLTPLIEKVETGFKAVKDESGPFLKKAALIGVGVIVLGIATYYTTRFIANKLERHLNRPKLDFSLTKAASQVNLEEHHALFREMIFADDVKERLNTVLLTTKSLKEKIQDGDDKARYRNLLICGLPGSGKRMFAHQLAQYANMDFFEITGSALTRFKDGEAAIATEAFLKNEPAKSGKGAVVYIDNASMLFTRRKAGDASSLTRLVTAFMEQAERRSNKYMIIFGAPLKPNPGGDIMSVIDDTIEINRPDENLRVRLLQQQRDKLFGTPDVGPGLSHSVQVHLNDEGIANIAQRLRNASSADICKVMETLKVEAQLPSEGVVSPALMERVVERAVAKYQELIA